MFVSRGFSDDLSLACVCAAVFSVVAAVAESEFCEPQTLARRSLSFFLKGISVLFDPKDKFDPPDSHRLPVHVIVVIYRQFI